MARTANPALQEERRAAICDAAYGLLARETYAAVTLARVAEAAQVSKGLVRYYFGNKESLMIATLRRYHQRLAEHLKAAALGEGTPHERLQRLIELSFPSREEVVTDHRFQAEAWSFAKSSDVAWLAVSDSYRDFRRACEALLDVGVEEGYARAEAVARLYATLHALIDGTCLQVALDPSLDLVDVRSRLLSTIEALIDAQGN